MDERPAKKRADQSKPKKPATRDDHREQRGEQTAKRLTASTISQIAKVSTSTVSRALKNDPSISAATRKRVVALAEHLGYQPNAAARSLITRRSNVVALIMGDMANPFYSEQLELLLQLLDRQQIRLMLFSVPSGKAIADVIPIVLQHQLDACIIAAVSLSSRASGILAAHNLPTVMINRIPDHSHGCAVLCDNVGGGATIARLFADRGARRPAFVAGKADASTSHERERGFLDALTEVGLPLAARLEGNYTREGGFKAGQDILQQKGARRPDAVFCANDVMALGLLDAMHLGGVAVPEEIQVAGFDDIRAAAWQPYQLTTIAQPMKFLLERAIEMVVRRLDAPHLKPETVYVGGTLHERATTRAPR